MTQKILHPKTGQVIGYIVLNEVVVIVKNI